MSAAAPEPRRWDDLDADTRTTLLVEYGRDLDRLPPTCDLTTKNIRFARWLAARGVLWTAEVGRARS